MMSTPPKPKFIAPPERSSDEVQAAAEDVRRRTLFGKGTSYLTGGTGVNTDNISFAASKLLGGGQ